MFEGYLIIGVDPHKKKHAVVAITQDFAVHCKFKFGNTKEGLRVMLDRAREEMVKSGCRGVMFAIETGGHYWRNIAYFLDERGLPLSFINQYTLKRRRERPVDTNSFGGRETEGAALNRLLRLAFTLVKNQTLYQSPQLIAVTG